MNICKLPEAQTLKVMQSKILKKVVFHKFFKFSFYKVAKKFIFYVLLVVQITIFCNSAKMLKSPENLKFLKNYCMVIFKNIVFTVLILHIGFS